MKFKTLQNLLNIVFENDELFGIKNLNDYNIQIINETLECNHRIIDVNNTEKTVIIVIGEDI